uniref:Uncharacterized protein n=1 Tax=Amphimedon queenslandica TaxID=400682 RepID=A0A1X7U949_AMPQE
MPVVTSGAVPALKYSYRVKIINPLKKSEVITELHNFHSKFESIGESQQKLASKFEDHFPSNGNEFNIGYYDGLHHAEVNVTSSDDLSRLYNNTVMEEK